MTLTWLWIRWESRRRWRSLAVVALLVMLSTAVVATTVAGARRAQSAPERLARATTAATALLLPTQGLEAEHWPTVAGLPDVVGSSVITESGISFRGLAENEELFTLPTDDRWFSTVERPVVLAGRLPNPAAADELVVTERFLTAHHTMLGARLDPVLNLQDGTEAALPRPRIVGVVRSPYLVDGIGLKGRIVMSPAFFERYRAIAEQDGQPPYLGMAVRLRHGAADLPAFRRALSRLPWAEGVEVQQRSVVVVRQQRVIDFESRFLLAIGTAALLASALGVGQTVFRQVGSHDGDLGLLAALGAGQLQRFWLVSAPPLLAALAGTVVGLAGSVLASTWFPIGFAAAFEPAPGLRVDLLVIGLTAVAALALVAGCAWTACALTAWTSTRSTSTVRAAEPWRGTAASRSMAALRVALPVPVLVGARFALFPGGGHTSRSTTLVAACAGVLGIVAALTFAAGIGEAATNPARFGQVASLAMFVSDDGDLPAAARNATTAARQNPDVAGLADVRWGILPATGAGRTVALNVLSTEPVGTAVPPVLTRGRMPQTDTEIVLAPDSAKTLQRAVGSSVTVRGRTFEVSGIGFVPEEWRNTYAEGAWITPAAWQQLFPIGSPDVFIRVIMAAARPGVSPAALAADLNQLPSVREVPGGFSVAPPPSRVGEVRQVRGLPLLLGGFLVLLALGALGHALAVTVRAGGRDLAVLRALGMTPRQTRFAVGSFASVLVLTGLVVGLPLGIALGRTLWRAVADATPVAYASPSLSTALLVAPTGLLAGLLLAVLPGERAARSRVVDVLRAE